MADELLQTEGATMVAAPALAEEAHFGLTYGGQVNHDQAQLLEGYDPLGYDDRWRHNGEQTYSGHSRYSRWLVTGEHYANERSALLLGAVPMTAADAWSMAAPDYNGLCMADGAACYGEPTSSPRDGLAIALTRQVRHNGRHNYAGLRHHAATNTEALTA